MSKKLFSFSVLSVLLALSSLVSCTLGKQMPTSILATPSVTVTATPFANIVVTPVTWPTETPAMSFSIPNNQQITLDNASQIKEIARLGKGIASDAEFSPDGKYIAIATTIGIYLYDAKTFQEVKFINIYTEPERIEFSQDGSLMAVGCYDSKLVIVSLPDAVVTRVFDVDPDVRDTSNFAITPDGKMVAVLLDLSGKYNQNVSVSLFSVSTGKLVLNKSIIHIEDPMQGDYSYDFALSPDDKTLAIYRNQNIELWKFPENALLKKIPSPSQADGLIFSPDGKLIAGTTRDNGIQIWDINSGSALPFNWGFGTYVEKLAFSADGNSFFAWSGSNVTRQWNLKTGEIIHNIHLGDDCYGFSLAPDQSSFLCRDQANVIYVRNFDTTELESTIDQFQRGYQSVVDFIQGGSILVTIGDDGYLKYLDPKTGNVLPDCPFKCLSFRQFAYSPNGKIFAYTTNDATNLIEASDGTFIRSLPVYNYFAFSSDGQLLAGATEKFIIEIRKVSDGQLLMTLPGHANQIPALAFSLDGQYLASGSWDKTVKLWRLSDGSLVRTLKSHENELSSIIFLPDGKTFVSGSYNGPLILWNIASGKELARNDVDGILSMALSPDGKIIATSSYDGSISLFDSTNLHLLNQLTGHNAMVDSIAFTPDGKEIASISGDGTIRFWGVMP
jgi:FOG: WD40 repeat